MTVTVKKYNTEQKSFEDHNLNGEIFAQDPNTHLMHLAVVRQLANARVGTASTLTRAEVRGGGRKPWKQKGTGRARAGSLRSPLFVGGGITFGPKPRDYSKKMNKKARKVALRSALSSEVENTMIISGDLVKSHKTKDFVSILNDLEISSEKILLVADKEANIYYASRNLPNVKLVYPENVGVYDIINSEKILITESALEKIERRAV